MTKFAKCFYRLGILAFSSLCSIAHAQAPAKEAPLKAVEGKKQASILMSKVSQHTWKIESQKNEAGIVEWYIKGTKTKVHLLHDKWQKEGTSLRMLDPSQVYEFRGMPVSSDKDKFTFFMSWGGLINSTDPKSHSKNSLFVDDTLEGKKAKSELTSFIAKGENQLKWRIKVDKEIKQEVRWHIVGMDSRTSRVLSIQRIEKNGKTTARYDLKELDPKSVYEFTGVPTNYCYGAASFLALSELKKAR